MTARLAWAISEDQRVPLASMAASLFCGIETTQRNGASAGVEITITRERFPAAATRLAEADP